MKLKYTKFQCVMEILSILLLIGMIIFLCSYWNQIPDTIPGHYNAMGQVDRWGNKSEVLILPILNIFMYLLLTVISFFPQIWNMPVKITDTNRVPVYQCSKTLLIIMKTQVVGIFFYLTYNTATSVSLSVYFLPIMILLVFGTMLYFIIRMIRISKLLG